MSYLVYGLLFLLVLTNYCWWAFFKSYRDTIKKHLEEQTNV